MRQLTSLRAWAVLVLALTCQGTAGAQTEGRGASGELLPSLQVSLDIVDRALARPDVSDADIDRLRRQVEFVATTARRIRSEAMEDATAKRRLLEALGPRPAETEPGEAPEVAAERQRLEESITKYQGQIKSADVVLARVESLRARMARAKFDFVAELLSQRTDTPLAPDLIVEAVSQVPWQFDRFTTRVAQWWQSVEFDRQRTRTVMSWMVLLVLVVAVVVPTRNWLLKRYGPDHRDEEPSVTRRFKVMMAVGVGNVLLPVVSIVGLYVVLLKSAAMTPDVHEMATLLMVTASEYFLITGLSAAALSPNHPRWRISRFTDEAAAALYRSIRLFAVIIVLVNLVRIPLTELQSMREMAGILVMDAMRDPLHTMVGTLAVAAIAISMLAILRRDNWRFVKTDESGDVSINPPSKIVRVFFSAARLGLVLSIAAALIGYVNLGVFLCQRVVRSLLLVALAYLLRAFILATCSQAVQEDSDIGELLRTKLGYSSAGATRLMFWVMLIVDLALVVAVMIALLLIWGVHATDVQNAAESILYGVAIGDFTFSLMDVGVALMIFIMLFIGVRLLQGFLSNRVLTQTVPDVGVRDALTTGIGYAGIIIAAIISISALGLELSQLAIIFGALSVGIGFGLQHVVNNFVSGLILLMHRPIKAGDWIVVGQHEGYVKKVNVVATEIQTFDNADVIVPNSQLVSSEVVNWTHKSTVARVIVSVGVSYDSSPEQVRDVLIRCASQRSDILNSPAPAVIFRDFGDSALIFELRFFIRQADYMLLTASDLRFAIADAFREAGIIIPYPQRDIHIKAPGLPASTTAATTAAPGETAAPAPGARPRGGGSDADGTG